MSARPRRAAAAKFVSKYTEDDEDEYEDEYDSDEDAPPSPKPKPKRSKKRKSTKVEPAKCGKWEAAGRTKPAADQPKSAGKQKAKAPPSAGTMSMSAFLKPNVDMHAAGRAAPPPAPAAAAAKSKGAKRRPQQARGKRKTYKESSDEEADETSETEGEEQDEEEGEEEGADDEANFQAEASNPFEKFRYGEGGKGSSKCQLARRPVAQRGRAASKPTRGGKPGKIKGKTAKGKYTEDSESEVWFARIVALCPLQPLSVIFTKRLGSFVSGARMRPNPRVRRRCRPGGSRSRRREPGRASRVAREAMDYKHICMLPCIFH
jgi:hypothetical protein